MKNLSKEAEDLLFLKARSYHKWLPTPVPQSVLEKIYDLMKWAPTSTNMSPLRITFLTSAVKEMLYACLMPANVPQTKEAPVTAILAYDLDFYKHLDVLSPINKARTWFEGKPDISLEAGRLNGILQAGYFIMAARACGLDCGPMTGFHQEKVDTVFFDDTPLRSFLICNLGYGDPEGVHPRGERLSFEKVCTIL